MKKELRSRIKNWCNHNKSANQTKPSEKKQRRKGVRHAGIPAPAAKPEEPTQQPTTDTEPILKSDGQSCETAPDIPYNISLDHYLDDICDHITRVDKSFHDNLTQGLKSAGNIEITSQMRKILLKWLIKIGRKFRVRSETMHMCVQLIDFMLIHQGNTFNKTNFQLLGVTCLFISCKYNQIYTIESQKYVEFCDGIYTIEQLFEMQSYILLSINFNLQIPTIYQFISKLQLQCKINGECLNMVKNLADMFIFDFNSFNNYKKHELSTVIVYFVAKLMKMDQLKNSVGFYKSKIEPDIFKQCFMAVVAMFKKSHLHNTNISI